MLERLEEKPSPLRRSNARASRKAVWNEILTRKPEYFERLLRVLDLGACVPVCLSGGYDRRGRGMHRLTNGRSCAPTTDSAGEHAKGMAAKKQREAVVQAVAALYEHLSSDIHHPGLWAIPIDLQKLGPTRGAMMIVHCQELEVAYVLYDGSIRLESPPPEVARLLGEREGKEEDDLIGTGVPEWVGVDAPLEEESGKGQGTGKGTGAGKKRKRKD